MSSTFTLGLIGGLFTLGVIFEMLRRQRLREKYAVIWVVVVLATVLLALFPQLLTRSANVLGVEVPANLLFFGAIMLLLFISIQLSYEIGRLEERTRTLAEEVALLRLQHEQAHGPSAPEPTDVVEPDDRGVDDEAKEDDRW
ncbi:DUF2304 domain-containing protein [Nocardioides baculatus]|uniref:DUF2304 domain-containing protein n=1 Tax=Nocardioides baculatus TaxID=2801337 RepID=A0ABS1L6G0_9ACTN|nr:DUF2304 domain-containing protein [Nocardioides baculatus]MBL0747200.1 DUF2304 domain-containing protein [Nocardioides baculatus]